MAASMTTCVCHVLQCENEPIIAVSDVSWQKLCECVNIWASLDGVEKELAINFDSVIRENAGYHRLCYQRFTNKKRIEQGIRRRVKGCLRLADKTSSASVSVPSPKKSKLTLRSKINTGRNVVRRSKHVLPEECIICKRNKVVVDKSTLKRKQEALITCETNADKLLQAAKLKGDDSILLPIGDLDPVCIEVRYHASCYKQYTKCLYSLKDTLGRSLAKTFDKFCKDVIDKRIILGGEVLRISSLTKSFISLALEVEGVDITHYRNDQIKQRLTRRYPNLKYVQPNLTTCEFVFHQTQDEETIIHFGQA